MSRVLTLTEKNTQKRQTHRQQLEEEQLETEATCRIAASVYGGRNAKVTDRYALSWRGWYQSLQAHSEETTGYAGGLPERLKNHH